MIDQLLDHLFGHDGWLEYWAFLCLLASLGLQLLPLPNESGVYMRLYNLIRFLAANRSFRIVRNGDQK